jgi:glycosyltransferase involved in cell wall biosynthesis
VDSGSALPVGRRRTGLLGDGQLRATFLALELAVWLRAQRYDLVWTQWPTMGGGRSPFWTAARALGLRLAHTAHNIVPREAVEGERRCYETVYRSSDVLIVHSQEAADALAREFPRAAPKAVLARHGLYTVFPRQPAARERMRAELGIGPEQRVVLCFGGLRPYKNTDGVVRAIAADDQRRLTLLVAGSETLGDGSRDPLAQTRQLVAAVGLDGRAHLRAGPFGFAETGALFEASDIVVLPYLESYGSGLLLLAMSFGKRVVATRTGGMAEYLPGYPGHVLLDRATPADILAGLRAVANLPEAGGQGRPGHLEWPAIVDELLPRLF